VKPVNFYFTNLFNFNNNQHEFESVSQNSFQNNSRTKTTEFTSKIDYEFLLKNNIQTETGIKALFRQYTFLPNYNGLMGAQTIFNQTIFGAYLSINKTIKKVMLRVGIRTELTRNKYIDDDNSTLNLMPNILFNYTINDKNSLKISYRKTLSRPSFLMLNTFANKETPFKITIGNPSLANQLLNSVELEESFVLGKTNLSFAVSYERGSKLINSKLFSDTEATTQVSYGNFSKSKSVKFFYSLNASIVPEKISLFSSGSIAYYNINGLGYENNGYLKTINLGLSYEPMPIIAVEFFINYLENAIALQSAYSNSIFTDLRTSYSYKKSSIGIQFTNPLQNKIIENNNGRAQNFAFSGISYYKGRSIAISYNYRFGKTKYHEKQTKEIQNSDINKGKKL
jgi:iron complex outermembrane receptor protein